MWDRLQVGEVPILWGGTRNYNPDLVVIEPGDAYLVEIKRDSDLADEDVAAKAAAGRHWAQHASAADSRRRWHYLLVPAGHLRPGITSWAAVKAVAL